MSTETPEEQCGCETQEEHDQYTAGRLLLREHVLGPRTLNADVAPECGFDRTASQSDDHYVCACGEDHEAALEQERKTREELDAADHAQILDLQQQLSSSIAECVALRAQIKLLYDYCFACGGISGYHEGCNGTTGLITLHAECDALRKDAERLDFLESLADEQVGIDIFPNFTEIQVKDQPPYDSTHTISKGPTLRAAIDAANKEQT